MLNALLKIWQKGYGKGITDCFKYSGIIFWGGNPTNRASINKNV